MARPIKKGLGYFPLDVDFLSDIKVKRIIRACGKEAIHILIALLCSIYRDEGYYILWNDDLAFLVADEVGAKEGTVDELVKKAVQVGFFDKNLYDKYQILTSSGIQNRYITATKERKEVVLKSEYLLTNEVNRSNISINRSNNSVNQGSNQQSKEKESKENKNKTYIPTSSSGSTDVPAPVNDSLDDIIVPFADILAYLNEKTGKRFSNIAGNQRYIQARWNEGKRLEDFKQVIDNMTINWQGKTFQGEPAEKFLQPSTLFGDKFDQYLNMVPAEPEETFTRPDDYYDVDF